MVVVVDVFQFPETILGSRSEMGEECRQFWAWILRANCLGGLKPWRNKADNFAGKIS